MKKRILVILGILFTQYNIMSSQTLTIEDNNLLYNIDFYHCEDKIIVKSYIVNNSYSSIFFPEQQVFSYILWNTNKDSTEYLLEHYFGWNCHRTYCFFAVSVKELKYRDTLKYNYEILNMTNKNINSFYLCYNYLDSEKIKKKWKNKSFSFYDYYRNAKYGSFYFKPVLIKQHKNK